MAWPVVIATNGFGIPVTESDSDYATPVEIAANGMGTPVVVVDAGGMPVKGVGVAWYDPEAILDADFANGRFRWDGSTYADETTFLTAIGGSKASAQRTIGPYVAPSATELIVNGTLATDLTGWTSILNGTSTATIVSAAARLTSDGTTGNGAGGAGITQGFTTVLDRAYGALFDAVTGTTGFRVGGTTDTGVGGAGGSKSVGSYAESFSADATTSYLYAFRSGVGNGGADNISVKEWLPFKNFVQGGFTARIRGVTPASASGTKVAFSLGQFGVTTDIDHVDLLYNASGELHVTVRYGGSTVADLNLGAVAVSTAFDVLLSAKADAFYAQLNSVLPILSDTAGGLSGFAGLYVAKSQQGNNWDGGDPRVQLWSGGGADQFYGLIEDAIHFEGDSFAGGAGGVVLPTTLQSLIGRTVYNTGTGGAAMSLISSRLVASSTAIKDKVTVIWDGGYNVAASIDAYADELEAGLVGIDRFVIIPACISRGQADLTVQNDIRDEFVSRWPDNVLDWRDVLDFDGSALDDTMYLATDGSDNIHLSQAAMDLMAEAIWQKMGFLGYVEAEEDRAYPTDYEKYVLADLSVKANIYNNGASGYNTVTDVASTDSPYGLSTAAEIAPSNNADRFYFNATLHAGLDVSSGDWSVEFDWKPKVNIGAKITSTQLVTRFDISLSHNAVAGALGSDYHNLAAPSGGGATDAVRAYSTAKDHSTAGRWQTFSAPLSAFYLVGSGATLSSLKQARIWVRAQTAFTVNIEIGQVRLVRNPRTKAACLITFDDAYASQYSYAFPLMQAYGFPGVLYPGALASVLDQPGRLTSAQIRELVSKRWQLGAQAYNTEDGPTFDAKTSEQRLADMAALRELQRSLDSVTDGGFDGSFFSGVAAFDRTAGPDLDASFRTLRRHDGGNAADPPITWGETFPFGDRHNVRALDGQTSGWGGGTVATRLQNHIDFAIAHNSVAIVNYHDIGNAGAEYKTAFETVLAYLDSNRATIEVITMRSLLYP